MTALLRLMGASIMGILDPVPSSVPSPMAGDEAAWVRANAWTKGLRRIEDAYPHGFFRWCSCECGTCHPCAVGRHGQCASVNGPRPDENAGTVTDRSGFVVALVQHGPAQRPCRWICRCDHPAAAEPPLDEVPEELSPVRQRSLRSGFPGVPEGQLPLFSGVRP
ncbi:DUF6248 family natural product biosynthesis protein [Streptomyces sp. NPDC015184]|uniref:DUF6248 family natural product biosynthesis protein n=1 Tax=Streptomyces sp. NPDC015184 TaxID=3364946 RepID=UPI0036F63FBB